MPLHYADCLQLFNINNRRYHNRNKINISNELQNNFYPDEKKFKQQIKRYFKEIYIEEDIEIHKLSKIETNLSEISEDYIILHVPAEEKYSVGNGVDFNSFKDAIEFLKKSNILINEIISLLPNYPLMVNEKYVLMRFQKMVQFIDIEYEEQINRELFDIALKSLFEYGDFLIKKHLLIEEDDYNIISKENIPKYKSYYFSFFSKFVELETNFYEFMGWDDDPLNEAVKLAYNELR